MKILFVSDIHITDKSKRVLDALKETLDNINDIDRIILLGDLFHHGAKIGSKTESIGYTFIKMLSEKAKTFVIAGTASHEMGYFNSSVFTESLSTVRFIKEPEVIDNILFIPEVYNLEKSDYTSLLSKSYDMICGHGTISKLVSFNVLTENEDSLERQAPRAPVFNISDFKNSPITVFGHEHTHNVSIQDGYTVAYCGSFMTNNFGELEAIKGALLLEDGILTKIGHSFDDKYIQKEVTNFTALQELIKLQESEPNTKVRAIITDDTPESTRNMIITKMNYKDISKNNVKNNSKVTDEQLELSDEYSDAYKSGLASVVTKYAEKNDIEIESTIVKVLVNEFYVNGG